MYTQSQSGSTVFCGLFDRGGGLVAWFLSKELRCSLSVRYGKFKGLNGQRFKIPIIGALAETQASK
jgi:uncharacterized membrane protein